MSFINCQIIGKRVSNADYQSQTAERGSPLFRMSSSALREFSRCPARWKAGYQSPDSDAKDYGSLLDCLVLTPEQFADRYTQQPSTYRTEKGEEKDWSNNAKVCRAWNEEQKASGRQIVKGHELTEAQQAVKALLADEVIAEWHAACDTQIWIAGLWIGERSDQSIPVKCLIDYAPRDDSEFAACLGDLKTARSGSLNAFQRWVFQAGYHIQGAFNLDLFNAATGQERDSFCLVGQENFAPWQPFRRLLSQDFIQMGRQTYQAALSRYAACVLSQRWPGYDDHPEALNGWSVVAPEPWMEFDALSEHLEAEQEQQAQEPQDEVGVTP